MLTNEGFKRKTYVEFIEEMQTQAKEIFGADINLTDRSPLAQWIALIALARAEENEKAEAVYNSAFIDDAEGVSLDKAVKYKSISRFDAAAATVTLEFNFDIGGGSIPAGTLVSTGNGVQFYTLDFAYDSQQIGYLFVNAQAVEVGANGNVEANTITELLTPIPGVISVTNNAASTGGQDRETDSELRNRYHATSGESSTPEGIASYLLNNVAGVQSAIVLDNKTDVTDGSGRPPHSLEVVVLGGDSTEIGQAILKSSPGGIQTHGTQTKVVKDMAGNNQTIKFSYATQKNIYVNLTITKTAAFPVDGSDTIKAAIYEYINALKMGDDVVLGKINSIAFQLEGVSDVSTTLSTDNSTFTAANVVIAATEVAKTSLDKLVITLV